MKRLVNWVLDRLFPVVTPPIIPPRTQKARGLNITFHNVVTYVPKRENKPLATVISIEDRRKAEFLVWRENNALLFA
jgi:hypothetical protein